MLTKEDVKDIALELLGLYLKLITILAVAIIAVTTAAFAIKLLRYILESSFLNF